MTAIERAEELLGVPRDHSGDCQLAHPCRTCTTALVDADKLRQRGPEILRGYISAVKALRDLRDMRGARTERQSRQNNAIHERVEVADADFERLFPEETPPAPPINFDRRG